MKSKNPADEYYSLYSAAIWEENRELQRKYKTLWLDTQKQNLPSGALRKLYKMKIDNLIVLHKPETDKLENYLLKQRFNFTAGIGGKDYTYRDLISPKSEETNNSKITQALIDETIQLIEAGFTDLIRQRNRIAQKEGYENYWMYKNPDQGDIIQKFLISLDQNLINYKEKPPLKIPNSGSSVDFAKAFEFFCSLLFSNQEIPRVEVIVRKGSHCPPGPPSVQPLAYRPDRGHILGINLPFVHQNRIENEKLGAFFHELTHLFHFAAVDSRGGYAFPSELAVDDLLYESEALCYQNLILSAWKEVPYYPDWTMLKDLVYVAETERQLYTMEHINRKTIQELITRRIEEHYPKRDFKRTPLGASHLIREESAGKYWTYAAAHWIGNQRINQILDKEMFLSFPSYWSEGNEASYRIRPDRLLDIHRGNIVFSENPIKPRDLKRRERKSIRRELDERGISEMILK
jgi:hypothetical protein